MKVRTPNEIKEQAIMCWKQMARPKYDKGQLEKGTNLDDNPDLITECRYEIIDLWFYLDSLAHQLDGKDSRIAELEYEVERWKEKAKR
jgi:hypothetical protein